ASSARRDIRLPGRQLARLSLLFARLQRRHDSDQRALLGQSHEDLQTTRRRRPGEGFLPYRAKFDVRRLFRHHAPELEYRKSAQIAETDSPRALPHTLWR